MARECFQAVTFRPNDDSAAHGTKRSTERKRLFMRLVRPNYASSRGQAMGKVTAGTGHTRPTPGVRTHVRSSCSSRDQWGQVGRSQATSSIATSLTSAARTASVSRISRHSTESWRTPFWPFERSTACQGHPTPTRSGSSWQKGGTPVLLRTVAAGV